MEKRIFLKDNIVYEIIENIEGWTIEDCFSPDFLAGCVPWQEGVTPGMVYDPETGGFSDPPSPPEPPPYIPPEDPAEILNALLGVE